MGIIQQQAIKGTVYAYIGVFIGFVTTAILFPRILSVEEIGLLRLLVSFSVIFSQFGSLGFNTVIYRLFPYFRDKDTGHNGFLSVAVLVSFMGALLSMAILGLLSSWIIDNNIDKSALFVDYFYLLFPLIFFTIFFNLFDTYNRALYDAIAGTVAKELFQRVFILLSIIAYFFQWVSLKQFVIIYTISLSLPAILMIILLISRKQILFTIPTRIFTRSMIKEILNLCFYGIIGGFASMAIFQVDSILVNKYLGLGMTGIYATNFYFGSLILISSRTLIKISVTVVSESWKNNDLSNIFSVYKKSAVNQSIVSVLLFVLIWVNIDSIYHILPEKFAAGKWVIFFVGLSNVVEMSTGVNRMIIQTSKYFRVNTLFIFIWLGLLIITNILLIPPLGITGAAIGTLFSNAVTNLLRFGFLKIRYNMQPFDYKIVLVLVFGGIAYFAGFLLPSLPHFIPDIILKSSVSLAVFIALVIKINISEEINTEFRKLLSKLSFKK